MDTQELSVILKPVSIVPHSRLVPGSYVFLERSRGLIKEVHCALNLVSHFERLLGITASPECKVNGCICEGYWRQQGAVDSKYSDRLKFPT
jgi:hypothetical protein